MVSCVITYDRVHCILFENIIKSLVHDSRVAGQCYSACCFPLLHRTGIAWQPSINALAERPCHAVAGRMAGFEGVPV